MNVSSVNQMAFTGKIAQTKNGNEYKKSNKWLAIGSIGCAADYLSGGIIAKTTKSPKIKNIIKELKALSKTKKVAIHAGVVAFWLTTGLVVDSLINKSRAKKADKRAEQA